MQAKCAVSFSGYILLALTSFAFASSAHAQTPSSGAATDSKAGDKSDKLDVSDLERKYWTAKDTDYSVVQNRIYTKAGRLAVSAQYGFLVNDSYSDGATLGVGANYFFSERLGLEARFAKTDSKDNKAVSAMTIYQGARPDHGKITSFYGGSLNFVPFYAKMSVLNTHIIYFDMVFSPGLGMTEYEQQIETGNRKKSALTYTFDVTQYFFLSKTFAFRFDYQNRWFREDVANYRVDSGTGGAATGQVLRTELNHTSLLMFGIQLFY